MAYDRQESGPQSLVVDVGGTHVKFEHSGSQERREFESGKSLSAATMVAEVLRMTTDWDYDVVTIGVPAPVVHGKLLHDPHNLGSGWVGFDFGSAFGKPTKLINDAAMQALGGYRGGKMLFLGLGTGLGSAMIVDGIVEPMELAHLPYKKGKTFEYYVGIRGLKRLGKKKWRMAVADVVNTLRDALEADYVLIGGGNARLLKQLPENTETAPNDNAFLGGFRCWK
ncbi:MAG: hypothetical protein KDA60_19400 [Planctomycetales bacterium]|nr:hypothetical protein [Planctomycetales bacterium]